MILYFNNLKKVLEVVRLHFHNSILENEIVVAFLFYFILQKIIHWFNILNSVKI